MTLISKQFRLRVKVLVTVIKTARTNHDVAAHLRIRSVAIEQV